MIRGYDPQGDSPIPGAEQAAEVILESRAFPPRRAAAMQHALTRSRVDHAGRRKKVFLNHGGDLRYALRIRRLPLRRAAQPLPLRRRAASSLRLTTPPTRSFRRASSGPLGVGYVDDACHS